MSVVISDTSPVRALAHLAHLDWLERLFGHVYVPPAVADELRHPPSAFPPIDVSASPHLVLRGPTNLTRVAELRTVLDAGEAEAIALAEELHADLVLVDELMGRRVARQCGLAVMGSLGVLVRAKQQGLCPLIAPLLDRLQNELKFFLSAELRQEVLKQAGE